MQSIVYKEDFLSITGHIFAKLDIRCNRYLKGKHVLRCAVCKFKPYLLPMTKRKHSNLAFNSPFLMVGNKQKNKCHQYSSWHLKVFEQNNLSEPRETF